MRLILHCYTIWQWIGLFYPLLCFAMASLLYADEGTKSGSFLATIQTLPDTPCAFFVLTGTIDPHIFHWTTFLPKENFTIFFIEDSINVEEIIPFEIAFPYREVESSPPRFILHLDADILNQTQYGGMNFVKGWITAWEKAMYFLIELKPTYQYMWFMEDDVLLLTPEAFLNIHKQLVTKRFDLFGGPSKRGDPETSNDWPHWPRIKTMQGVYSPPFYRSMVCAVGISQRLLQKIAWFRTQQFEFLEVMFLTIAKKENLTIHSPVAFKEVEWTGKHHCHKVGKLKKFWYHPVKHQAEFIKHCLETNVWKAEIAKYQSPSLFSPTLQKKYLPEKKQSPKNLTLLCLQTYHYPLAIYDWTLELPRSEFVVLFIEYNQEKQAVSKFSRLPREKEKLSNHWIASPRRFQLSLASSHSLVKDSPRLLSLLTIFFSKFLPTASPYFTWLFELPLLIPSSQSFLAMHTQVIQSENHYLTMSETFQYHNSSNYSFRPVMGVGRKWFEELKHQHTVSVTTSSLLVFGKASSQNNRSNSGNKSSSLFQLPPLMDGSNLTCEEFRNYRQHSSEQDTVPVVLSYPRALQI